MSAAIEQPWFVAHSLRPSFSCFNLRSRSTSLSLYLAAAFPVPFHVTARVRACTTLLEPSAGSQIFRLSISSYGPDIVRLTLVPAGTSHCKLFEARMQHRPVRRRHSRARLCEYQPVQYLPRVHALRPFPPHPHGLGQYDSQHVARPLQPTTRTHGEERSGKSSCKSSCQSSLFPIIATALHWRRSVPSYSTSP